MPYHEWHRQKCHLFKSKQVQVGLYSYVFLSYKEMEFQQKKKQQENNKHQIKDHTKTSKIIKTKLVYICIRDHRVAYTHVYTYVQAYAYTHTSYWTDNGIRMDVYNGVLALDGTAVYNISGSTKISEGPKLV